MSIRLSPKHGVNPSIDLCFFCQKEKGILLPGKLPDDAEAPHAACYNMEPCDTCKGYMDEGIIFISTKNGDHGNNPFRTGGWAVLSEEAVCRLVKPGDVWEQILKARVCFIENATWTAMGLPPLPVLQ